MTGLSLVKTTLMTPACTECLIISSTPSCHFLLTGIKGSAMTKYKAQVYYIIYCDFSVDSFNIRIHYFSQRIKEIHFPRKNTILNSQSLYDLLENGLNKDLLFL